MTLCFIERTLSHGNFAGFPYEMQRGARLSRLALPPVVVDQGKRKISFDHLSHLITLVWRPFEVFEDRHDDVVVLFR